MSLLERQHSWMVTTALAAGALGYAYLVFLPAQQAIGRLRDQRDREQRFIATASKMTSEIEEARHEIERAREFAANWEAVAADETQIATLFAKISDHARQAGTTTLKFEPQRAVRFDSVQKAPIVLGSQGSFRQIFDLLARLEALPQTIWVENLRLEAEGPDSELVKSELTLEVFADNRENSN